MSESDTPDLASDGRVSRRTLLARSAGASLGLVVSGSLPGVFGSAEAAGMVAGYGPLVPDPAGILSLPKDFSYSLVAEAGVTMLDSGQPTPSDADGTAAFLRRGGNGTVLVNNHEIGGSEPFPVPHVAGLVYDEAAKGGTTTIEVDRNGRRVREYVSVAGTHNNCAGGRTPWETWLTCEETEAILSGGKRHGYVFEVDPYDMAANSDPKPIKALGRFAHESVDVFFLARNEMAGDSEFTGPTFSRDGRTLFANIQSPGHVFAIRGPFHRIR